MIGVPKHRPFFTTLPLPCNILNTNRRTKKQGRPGNKASFDIVAMVAKVQISQGIPQPLLLLLETLYIEILTNTIIMMANLTHIVARNQKPNKPQGTIYITYNLWKFSATYMY